MMIPIRRSMSALFLGLALLACLGPPPAEAGFATTYAVLLAQAKGNITNAYGPVKAKVSASAQVLTVQFDLVAGTGYGAGTVTATTNAKGQVVKLKKGTQTCNMAYTSAGAIKSVSCSTTRRQLGGDTDQEGEEGRDGEHQMDEGDGAGADGVPLANRHRRLAECSACVTLVRTAFSTKIKALCGASSKFPAPYVWAARAATSLCSMTSKLGSPVVLANKTCRCCLRNANCASGVCSAGACLTTKIASGGKCPDRENQDCQNGKCARASYPSGEYVCCPSNSTYISANATFCRPVTASPTKSPVVAVTFPPSQSPTRSSPGSNCLGEWPDPGPIDVGECNNRTCYSHTRRANDSATVFLSNSLPGVGSYECRSTVTSAISIEGGCMTVVPKFDDGAVVMALSRYRRLSPCHIQASWIVGSTYDRTQYGYPYVRMNWDSDYKNNYTVGWFAFPAAVCGGSNKVKDFHSFQCFYSGSCHPVNLRTNAYNNCYMMNGYNVSDPKTACVVCDYTQCVVAS